MILYADKVTDSMQRAMDETNRRRVIQTAYNVEHNITPVTVKTAIRSIIEDEVEAHQLAQDAAAGAVAPDVVTAEYLEELQKEMLAAAQDMEFERAALLRDKIATLKGEKVASPQGKKGKDKAKAKGRGVPKAGGPSRRPPRPQVG